jgi:hypothetical protein
MRIYNAFLGYIKKKEGENEEEERAICHITTVCSLVVEYTCVCCSVWWAVKKQAGTKGKGD